MTVLLAAVFGALVGSFLNVAVHRWHTGESVVHPPSRCPACGHRIRPLDNVPVLSWVVLGGKCRDCRAPISAAYPATEAAAAALAALVASRAGLGVEAVFDFAVLAAFLAASRVDFATTILPDRFLVAAGVAALLARLAAGGEGALAAGLLGAGALAAAFAAVLWAGSVAFRRDAMGWGDVKMAAVVGLWLGLPAGWLAAGAAVVAGAVVGVAAKALAGARRRRLGGEAGPWTLRWLGNGPPPAGVATALAAQGLEAGGDGPAWRVTGAPGPEGVEKGLEGLAGAAPAEFSLAEEGAEVPFGPFIALGALAARLWPDALAGWWGTLSGLLGPG